MASPSEDRFEIAFFDVETTVPTRIGQGHTILEFGSILVCPRKLVELESYSSLVRPADLNSITSLSARKNGINHDAVVKAPSFQDIADRVYDILHGRIWAGHNILRFDCPRIREAFSHIGRPAPEPKATIDSLQLLTQRFGRRAGNMKLVTLATYFRLGEQTHRSLDDVRMNLKVLERCATVLLLESSLPDILTESSWVSPESASTAAESESFSIFGGFLQPDEVFIPSIRASLVPLYRGSRRIKLLHKDATLQLCCRHMKLRFGINSKFFDHAGRPRLNIVAYASPNLCNVLEECDRIAQKLSSKSGSNSEWRPVVIRKEGFYNYPTVRLHIQTAVCGNIAIYATEIYQKELSGTQQGLVFTKIDDSELSTLFTPGMFMDAFFSLDPYDYQQSAGIRLVAKKLIIHSS